MGINFSGLAKLDVFGLGLRNLQLGLEVLRLYHLGQRGPGNGALADLDRHLLQHSADACMHFQILKVLMFELRKSAHLINFGLLHSKLGRNCLAVHGNAVLLNLVAGG